MRSEGVQVPAEHTDFNLFPAWVDLKQRLDAALMLGIGNPYFKVLEGVARDKVVIRGEEMIHFSGYNYLGFSGHPYVTQRVCDAVARYGTSVSASRVASGDRPIHHELEKRIAKAIGVDDAVLFTAGHMTNVNVIGHLFGPKDLILHDELIHDSALQGMKLAGSTRRPFPHGDMAALEKNLEAHRGRFEKCLVILEGVYSMDGDICDLPAAIVLKKRFKSFLMVDEAHSFGVVGKHGYGVAEHFGIDGREVDIWMGTLSKSLSSCGGYIASSHTLVQLLKYTAPGFVYSAGLSPANTMASLAALELMEREPQHVAKLQATAKRFYELCRANGLDTGPAAGESAVIPVIVGNSFHALLLSDALMKRGINVQPILYPAVADNASRLRFFLSALHTEEELVYTARTVNEELERIRAENGV
jgi:8-amino-7-oxononanoate synthase